MSDSSRHSSYSRSHIPRQKRTIRLRGERDDTGKYYRCWNCGFTCNIERDALGDSQTGFGISFKDGCTPSHPTLSGDSFSTTIVMDDMFTVIDPSVTGYRHNIYPDVVSGCPLCGTRNWR